jgi:hypothetical protein
VTVSTGTLPIGAIESALTQGLQRRLVTVLAIGGGSLLIAGSVLPWLSLYAGIDPISGIDGLNGRLLAGTGAVSAAAGLIYMWQPSKQLQYGLAALGFVASGFAAWVLSQLLGSYQELQSDPFVVASLGTGTFVALAGALILLGTLLVPRTAHVGREGSRQLTVLSAQRDARTVLLTGVVTFLVCAALIHLAVVGPHLAESGLYAAFFVSAAVAQLIAAMALTMTRNRRWLMAIALGNALIIVVWAVSRTVGLPIGPTPGVAESVSVPDVLATVAEVAIVTLSVALVRIRHPLSMRRWIVGGTAILVPVIALVIAVVAIIGVEAGGG